MALREWALLLPLRAINLTDRHFLSIFVRYDSVNVRGRIWNGLDTLHYILAPIIPEQLAADHIALNLTGRDLQLLALQWHLLDLAGLVPVEVAEDALIEDGALSLAYMAVYLLV